MLLQLIGLSKSFGAVVVADDIHLQIDEGEAVGIIGPNGAGKSSLFNLISGAVQPDGGQIIFAGRDITRLAVRSRCVAGIGRSFQIPQPFQHLTVYENLAVAACFGALQREADVKDHCVDVLRQTGLLAKANRLAASLTLLERKRLEMARALATRPRLLLLDEIAGGLTERECHDLVALIQQVRQDAAIIWIEHVVHALISVVDRLIALNFGALIATGAPAEVMRSEAVQKIYLGIE